MVVAHHGFDGFFHGDRFAASGDPPIAEGWSGHDGTEAKAK
jgi:hypothetical protein